MTDQTPPPGSTPDEPTPQPTSPPPGWQPPPPSAAWQPPPPSAAQPPPPPGQPPYPGTQYPGTAYPGTPYPGTQYPAAPGSYPPAPASKGMAITALVLAILGFLCVTAIAAIVLAIIVLNRAKDGRDHGKGLAIAALVIAPFWLVAIVALGAVGVLDEADRDSSGSISEEGNVRVNSVQVGDCVEKAIAGDNLFSVPATPCDQPHVLEAYAEFELPGGDYPGDDAVLQLAEQGCFDRYEAFVGRSYDDSTLEVQYLYPLQSSWRTDKAVTCFVGAGSPTTGSLRGSNQ